MSLYRTPSGQILHLDGRLKSCPNLNCKGAQLIEKHLSPTHAIKGCKNCKRKFIYIRTDTKTGKRLSNANRQAAYRRNRQSKQFDAQGVIV